MRSLLGKRRIVFASLILGDSISIYLKTYGFSPIRANARAETERFCKAISIFMTLGSPKKRPRTRRCLSRLPAAVVYANAVQKRRTVYLVQRNGLDEISHQSLERGRQYQFDGCGGMGIRFRAA